MSLGENDMSYGITKLAADGVNFPQWKSAVTSRLKARAKFGYRCIAFIEEPLAKRPEVSILQSHPPLYQTRSTTSTSSRTGIESSLPAETQNEDASLNGQMSALDHYEIAKSYVHDFLCNTVVLQLRIAVQDKEPVELMNYFRDRFRPTNSTTVALLENRLQNLTAQKKTHPYDSVCSYFSKVEDLEKDRAIIDSGEFDNNMLLYSTLVALGDLNDESIITYTRTWKTVHLGKPEYTYIKYKTFLQDVLLTEKHESETRIKRGNTTAPKSISEGPESSVNIAGGIQQKRGRSDTTDGKLAPSTGSEPKRPRSGLRRKSNKHCDKKLGGCGMIGHTVETCWTLHPELRTSRDRNSNKKKTVPVYLTEDVHRKQYHAYKATTSRSTRQKTGWYIDSGASDWICNDVTVFNPFTTFQTPRQISLGDHTEIPAIGYGSITIETELVNLAVNMALFAPEMGLNLVSVPRLIERGADVNFSLAGCVIRVQGEVIATASRESTTGLYKLDEEISQSTPSDITNHFISANAATVKEKATKLKNLSKLSRKPSPDLHRWHRRLGHLHYSAVHKVLKSLGIREQKTMTDYDNEFVCEPCILGKQTAMPNHEPSKHKATRPLELIHIDTNGPWATPSLHKRHAGLTNSTRSMSKYVLVLVDDFTGMVWTRYYHNRDTFRDAFIQFVTMVEDTVEDGRRVRRIRIDNAREFIAEYIEDFCTLKGIEIEPIAAYAHEQNAIAERINRTLRDMAATMLIESGLPEGFWAEAFRTATTIRNRCPSNKNFAMLDQGDQESDKSAPEEVPQDITPYERFYKVKPGYMHLKPFSCLVYVTTPKEKKVKVLSQHRAWRGILLGYTKSEKQFRV